MVLPSMRFIHINHGEAKLFSPRRLDLAASADLLARLDLEFAVDVAQMPGDRVARHENQLSDLTVRKAFCPQLRHPELGRGQRLNAGDRGPAGPPTGRRQLVAKLGFDAGCATSMR